MSQGNFSAGDQIYTCPQTCNKCLNESGYAKNYSKNSSVTCAKIESSLFALGILHGWRIGHVLSDD